MILTFAVNKVPFTGGPAYRLFDIETHQEKKQDENNITITSEDFQKIEKTLQNSESINEDKYYLVTAVVQLEKITESNTSIPGAPEFTYYEAHILEIKSVQ